MKDVSPVSSLKTRIQVTREPHHSKLHLKILFTFYKQIFIASYHKIRMNESKLTRSLKGDHGAKLLSLLVVLYLNSNQSDRDNFTKYAIHVAKSDSLSTNMNGLYLFHLLFDVDFGFHIEKHIENGEISTAYFRFQQDLVENAKNHHDQLPIEALNTQMKSMDLQINYDELNRIVEDGSIIPKVVDIAYNAYVKILPYADKYDYNII